MAGPWTLECEFPLDVSASNRWLFYGRKSMNARRGFKILRTNVIAKVDISWEAQYRTSGSLKLLKDGKQLVHLFEFGLTNGCLWDGKDLNLTLEPGTYTWKFGRLEGDRRCPFAHCNLSLLERADAA